MIKRQFYALEHSRADSGSSGSSSSSLGTASDVESGGVDAVDDSAWPASSHESDETSGEEEEVVSKRAGSDADRRAAAIRFSEKRLSELNEDSRETASCSDEEGGGDSCAAEVAEDEFSQRKLSNQWAEAVEEDEAERSIAKFEGTTVVCVGAANKVLKCRLCPKVVCLNSETMEAHLSSKRHARSLKQLASGKLVVQLDSEGEEEEDGETHAERYARVMASTQEDETPKRKRDLGRQRQRKRAKIRALKLASKKEGDELKLQSHKEGGAGCAPTVVVEETEAQMSLNKVIRGRVRKTRGSAGM